MTFRLFKDLVAGDVHVTSAIGNDKKRKPKPGAMVAGGNKKPDQAAKAEWSITAPITKIDEDQRMVWGWASVISEAGEVVTDSQGDQIDAADLVKAAHEFMTESRVGGDMHTTMGIGAVVESLVFTEEAQKALGVDLGKVGWFIGLKVEDDGVWKRVKSGDLAAFSFGGRGIREAVKA